MSQDFSLFGREKNLAEEFYQLFNLDLAREFWFARRTLLGRVIRKFTPEGFYCHLDGWDEDQFVKFDDGFYFSGRIFHLNVEKPKLPEHQVAIVVEFDRFSLTVKKAKIWFGINPCYLNDLLGIRADDLCFLFSEDFNMGSDWELAFLRNELGWMKMDRFDLMPFLKANGDR